MCEKLTNVNRGGVKWDKWISATNIIINLIILAVYKYFNFFVESFLSVCADFGYHPGSVTLNLILPVGISFYTFQALSYTIDVYKRKLEPTHDVIAFFAFISFFPQLVAGPIERATNLLPQFLKSRNFDYATAVDGSRQILWGLFKKVVVADSCAIPVNLIWSEFHELSSLQLLSGAVLFSFQIYGDFSGYSDIAIGTAKLFNIRLMRNFNYPYFSRDIAEFWRRWHISLTTWFRDYIYIPLGGSRCVKWKVARNTLVIFLVSGLWHGANWTFVLWGAYHAFLFFPLLFLGLNRKYIDGVAEGRLLPNRKEALQMLSTFFLAVIGWIIFRSENITQCYEYMSRMLAFHAGSAPYGMKALLFCLIMIVFEWFNRTREYPFQVINWGILKYRPIRILFYYCVIMMLFWTFGSTQQVDFIYFQF
jgi:D-alanyl-lipoteichoic acid acyltransferase DltB (MBOAT superfamily)